MGLRTNSFSQPLDPNTTAGRDAGAAGQGREAQIDAEIAQQHAKCLTELRAYIDDVQPQVESLKKEVEAAVAEVEKLDEPRKRLQALGARFDGLRSGFYTTRAELERKVTASAPRKLQALVQNLEQRLQTPALEKAIRELQKLKFEPGDTAPAMRTIMATLASEAAAEDLSRVKHLLS